MRDKGGRPGWWHGAVGLALLLAGCATAPPPVPELVWPLPPEPPRIKYLESWRGKDDFGGSGREKVLEVLLGERVGKERMAKPYAVTTDAKGRIYVTDTGLGRVWIFDREKKEVRSLGESGQGQLATPSGVVVDERGVVFVADAKMDRVFGYDQTGKLVLAIGTKDEFYSPSGLAVHPASNRLYVADTGRHKIRVYDRSSGQFLTEFGTRGTAPGSFNFPTHLHLRNGELYVTDTMNFRVQVFGLDGGFRRSLGEVGASLGQLARPKGVAVDAEGQVYVVDAAFNNFQIFDGEGKLLLFVGKIGLNPGEFWLPAGLHIDEEDRIYVVDQYNHRVQVFQYLGQRHASRAKQQNGKTP